MKRFIRKGSPSRHMLTLMTGTGVAQAIPVAISPILTRLYTPAQMGVFGVFLAIVAVLGVAASGRYELAVQLAEDDDEAVNMAALGVVVAAAFSILLLVLVLLFRDRFAHFLGNEAIAPWLFLVPPAAFLSGLQSVLSYLNSRGKRFSVIARASVYKSLALATAQSVLGLARAGAGGLIVGQFVSMCAANTGLYRGGVGNRSLRASLSWARIRAGAAKHIDLPKFTLWAGLANALSLNVTTVLISNMYMIMAAGHYVLVQRVLGAPSGLLGSAAGQVFFQRATEAKRQSGSARPIFVKTSLGLAAIGVPVFLLLFLMAEPLFGFVFGEEWRVAGRYARVLTPLFAVRFVVSPVSLMNQINGQNRAGMVFQLLLLGSTASIILISARAGFSIEFMLALLSGVGSMLYAGLFVFIFATSGRSREPVAGVGG